MNEDCRLCATVAGRQATYSRRNIENTILLKTQNFIVVPALGPLISGHVLIVSTLHFPSIASMGIEAIVEYEKIVGLLPYPLSIEQSIFLIFPHIIYLFDAMLIIFTISYIKFLKEEIRNP